jgi:hypothetical protein
VVFQSVVDWGQVKVRKIKVQTGGTAVVSVGYHSASVG